MEEITIMGVRIRKSPESSGYRRDCEYQKRGFCQTCTCDKCQGGLLIDEWKEAVRQGCITSGPRECDCVERARNQKRLRDSGLERLAARCTFDSFKTSKPWQSAMKKTALDYLKEYRHASFFIAGQSGCGKTHILTAVCNEIIQRGGRLRYFQWVFDGTRLKTLVNEREEYAKAIRELIEVPYLYLDDLFKSEITAADVRLGYEILNGRYNAGRPTMISSERSLEYIRAARGGDGEAIAGRIFETCGHGRFVIHLTGADKNLRFQGGA